jgi:acetylornithine aminotransferase
VPLTYDVVLILDEIYNRVRKKRKVFLHLYHDIKADIICLAKGGNGFPIGGILTLNSQRVMDYWELYGGNPFGLCCWNSSLDVIESQN